MPGTVIDINLCASITISTNPPSQMGTVWLMKKVRLQASPPLPFRSAMTVWSWKCGLKYIHTHVYIIIYIYIYIQHTDDTFSPSIKIPSIGFGLLSCSRCTCRYRACAPSKYSSNCPISLSSAVPSLFHFTFLC